MDFAQKAKVIGFCPVAIGAFNRIDEEPLKYPLLLSSPILPEPKATPEVFKLFALELSSFTEPLNGIQSKRLSFNEEFGKRIVEAFASEVTLRFFTPFTNTFRSIWNGEYVPEETIIESKLSEALIAACIVAN